MPNENNNQSNESRGSRKPFSGKGPKGSGKPFNKGGNKGGKKPFKKDGDRKPFKKDGEKEERGERKPFSKDGKRPFKKDGEKKFQKRENRDHRPNRPSLAEQAEFAPYRGELHRERTDKKKKSYLEVEMEKAREAVSPARLVALEVTKQARIRDAFAHELLDRYLNDAELSPEDRAFATLLVMGVTTTVGTLDYALDRSMRSPDDIGPDVRDALRISAYEILYLDKASHAAVDQGVELVRSIQPKAAGLSNAVLHRIDEAREEFPWGDPDTDIAAFARKHAFPEWLAEMLVADMGEPAAKELMASANDAAPLFVAVNAAKATDEEIVKLFEEAGTMAVKAQIADHPINGCYLIKDARAMGKPEVVAAIEAGKLLVSDIASQTIADIALPKECPGSFLEIGAGRATKTILLQQGAVRKYGQQMQLTTLDNLEYKRNLLIDRVATYGIKVIEALTGDARILHRAVGKKTYDAIFIDAPCSGLGTLRRHPEIKWRVNQEHINVLADTGLSMLKSASKQVAPGGVITFATCTVTTAENVGTVKAFLASEEGKGFQLEGIDGKAYFASRQTTNPNSPDAHFAVRFRKVQ